MSIDGQGDGVADLGVAADRAGRGDRAAGLGDVDGVIRRDVRIERDRRDRGGGVDRIAFGIGGKAGVARRIAGVDPGVDRLVGIGDQVAAGDVDAEGVAA